MTAPQARTTIGQLVYRVLPPLDLARLTADLDAALGGCDAARVCRALERDGVALIDHGGSRIGVALTRGLDRAGGAAITVTVGYGPAPGPEASLARRQAVLARLIAQRIAARFPPLETIWSESDEPATEEGFERLREELVERRRLQAEARAARARARSAPPRQALEPGDVQRMFSRLETALDARRLGRVELALAAGSPAALAAEQPEEAPASPALRLAAHLLDATLMLVALPVGVAMMVYSLGRGADINTSARVMAISGTGLGLLHLSGSAAALRILLI